MRFTFVILLFLSLGVDAQMIIKGHPNYIPLNQFSGLLDNYSGAAGAYSLRKLDKDYTGNAIRVRRSNDNTEQDIGFTSAGDLDTASLKTFVGSNNGFVVTWYDQSGNARNGSQGTAVNQPRIVNAGTVERISGEPSLFFDGSNDHFRNDGLSNDITGEDKPASFFSVVNKTNTNTAGTILGLGRGLNDVTLIAGNAFNSSSQFSFQIRDNANTSIIRTATVNYAANTNYLYSTITTGTAVSFFINSTDRTPATNTVNVGTLTLDRGAIAALQRIGASSFFGGYLSECILYASDQSSNRSGIETNINNYYGIY